MSYCGCYTENVFAFLEIHLQTLAQTIKAYIKDPNDFLNKLKPGTIILSTMDVIRLCPLIPQGKDLFALRK